MRRDPFDCGDLLAYLRGMRSDRSPTLANLFTDYEPDIRKTLDRIARESGLVNDESVALEFTERGGSMLFRSVPSERRVLVDWRGVASLWAMSQAMGRLSPALFNARRNGAGRLDLVDDSPEALGHHFIEYAKQLAVPQSWRWNTFFPKPDRNIEAGKPGDIFFFRAIEWILRHELAHVALKHPDVATTADQTRTEEREADLLATRAIKGGLATDTGREPGAKPSENELELERRALAAGIGLIWVALYEEIGAQTSEMYPPIADRIFRCLEEFGLAPDSAASEILSDFIKAWIDPQGAWSVLPADQATARAAMDEACGRLDDHIRKLRAT